MFALKIVLTILSPLYFHTDFRISLSIPAKKVAFTRIILNLQINLGSIAIFTIVCLSIHEHGMSLFRCFVVFRV